MLTLAVALAFAPAAMAVEIVLEPTAPSQATSTSNVVAQADDLGTPAGETLVYGTARPGEQLDAFRFVAPASGPVTVTLLLEDPLLYEQLAPRLSLVSGDGLPMATARQGPAPAAFDAFSLQTLRPLSSLTATLVAGRPYTLEVRPAQSTGLTIPYTMRYSQPAAATPAFTLAWLAAVPRLWTGLYAQRSFRPVTAAVFVLLVALLAIAATLVGIAIFQRVAERVRRSREAPIPQGEPAIMAPRIPVPAQPAPATVPMPLPVDGPSELPPPQPAPPPRPVPAAAAAPSIPPAVAASAPVPRVVADQREIERSATHAPSTPPVSTAPAHVPLEPRPAPEPQPVPEPAPATPEPEPAGPADAAVAYADAPRARADKAKPASGLEDLLGAWDYDQQPPRT